MAEWIPVGRQLPSAGKHVLIARTTGKLSIGHIVGPLGWGLKPDNWYKEGVAKFHDVVSYRLVGVTHWMPLPEPPDAEAGCEAAIMDDSKAWFKGVSIAGCWPDEAEEMKRSHLFVQLSRYEKFVEPVKGEIGMMAGVRFFVKEG